MSSYRKRILRELKRFRDQVGPTEYLNLDPRNILGRPADSSYSAAINQLLQEQIVLAVKTPDNSTGFRLNHTKINQVEKELQPWYMNSRVQWVIATIIAGAGIIIAIIAALKQK